jgi:IS30 family transposase
LNWSPEQVAGWLKRAYPEDELYQVSHETIYRSLFVQARGVLKKELLHHLRAKRNKSRISSQSVSDRRRLKIGRYLVIGKAISCPGRRTVTSRHWWNVIRVT